MTAIQKMELCTADVRFCTLYPNKVIGIALLAKHGTIELPEGKKEL
jgi:hypothetical protein